MVLRQTGSLDHCKFLFTYLFFIFSILIASVQGHMYLFLRHICFYSNIFGFETKVCWLSCHIYFLLDVILKLVTMHALKATIQKKKKNYACMLVRFFLFVIYSAAFFVLYFFWESNNFIRWLLNNYQSICQIKMIRGLRKLQPNPHQKKMNYDSDCSY